MIKGKATIQLFDGVTGKKVHEQDDKNFLTNAITNLLNPDFDIKNINTNIQKNIWTSCLPFYNKLLRGILLFDDVLPNDPNCIIAPSHINLLGHAASEYSGTDLYKGTYNTNESGSIENGWRHVFDFATDKANGTIKSIALTSFNGGNTGFSYSADKVMTRGLSSFNSSGSDVSSEDGLMTTSSSTGNYFCNPKKGVYIYAQISSSTNTLTLKKLERNYEKSGVSLLDTAFTSELFGSKIVLTKELPLPVLKGTNNYNITLSMADLYSHTVDSNDNIVVFSTRAYYEPTNIMKTVFDSDTLEIISNEIINLDKSLANSTGVEGQTLLYDDKIYTIQGIEKTNAQPRIDIFTHDGTFINSVALSTTTANMRGNSIIGDWVCFNGAIQSLRGASENVILHGTGLTNNYYIRPSKDVKPPYYVVHYMGDYPRLVVFTPFLGTIDNLSTPITKTESQTMKIIYDLVESN